MRKIVFIILALLLTIAVKAQDFKSFYTIENDGSVELDITNYDFHERFYTVYYLYNDSRFDISEGKANGLFKIKSKENIDSFLAALHTDFSELDKYDLDDMLDFTKGYLPEEFVTSMLLDIALDNGKGVTVNSHCVDSDPFCTSEIITFMAPANSVNETIPDAGCLHSKPCPAWFHMRINTPGQFIIHMEGVDPNTNVQRDIDFCLWGPFTDPTSPCTAQLTTNKIIDCSYSGNNTEDAYLGYQSGHSHHGASHGTVNYHLPESGEYYILLITNYSQENCRISFTKQANSGPGTTDCSILEPFLQANTPCIGENLVLEANVIEGASYTWTDPNNQTHSGRTWTRTNAQLSMAGLYTCHVVAGNSSGDESINAFVLPNVTADFTFPNQCIVGQPVQFTGTETTNPAGHTSDINVRQWAFGDGATSTSVNPTHTYSNPGDYQVSYNVAITGGNEGECGDTKVKTVQVRNQLGVTVGSDGTSFCEGDAVPNLTANATGGFGNYTYSWTSTPACQIDYPNSANTTAHPAVGNTTFTCTVSDGQATLTQSVSVTVNAIPNVNISGPEPPHISYGASATLSVPQMSGATYSWTSDPANQIQSGQNSNQITTKSLTAPTTFYVTVSKNGCSDSNEFVLAVGDALFGNVEITGQSEICSGETTTLKVNPSGGTEQYTFNWQPANMIEGSNTLQTITTKELTSSLSFTCTITDTENHTYNASSSQIIVNPIPDAMAFVEDNGTTYETYNVLTGSQVMLAMNDIQGATYSWEPASLISSFVPNTSNRIAQTIAFSDTGDKEFTGTVTTASGCSNEDNVVVRVFESLSNSYITASDDIVCEYFEVILTAHPEGGTGNFSYHWIPEENYSDPHSQSTAVHPNRYVHTFACVITDEGIDDMTNNQIEKSFSIGIKDRPTVNQELIGQTQVVPGIDYMPYIYEYNVNVSSLHGHDIEHATYTWEIYSYYDTPNHLEGGASTWLVFRDNEDPNKAYVSIDEEGNALLKCIISTECGSATTEKFIYTDGYNNGVSVDEISYDKMISVFPNPSNGELYIGYNDILVSTPLIIRIYNYNGMLIDQIYGETSSNVTHYSMEGLANGLYLVQVMGDDFVVTKKFVLNK